MDLLDELKNLITKLNKENIEHALCGGLAMAVYALPRATLDIDLLIEASSLENTKHAVRELGFTVQAAPMEFHDGKIHIHRVSKIEPETGETLILDLLTVTSEIMKAWETRTEVEWEHGAISVVSPRGLILLKSFRKSGQDQDDINFLRSIIDED
ncbi:MAG: nucleotidyltransferase family protein [Desulfobacteraceae bacterium]|nr:nucleotidyltransferase family protein [Desulfobacteraceae bacterium]